MQFGFRRLAPAPIVLALILGVPGAVAQLQPGETAVIDFEATLDEAFLDVALATETPEYPLAARFEITITDRSREQSADAGGQGSGGSLTNRFFLDFAWAGEPPSDPAWSLASPGGIKQTSSGESFTETFGFNHLPSVTTPFVEGVLSVRMQSSAYPSLQIQRNFTVAARVIGEPGLVLTLGPTTLQPSTTQKPGSVVTVPFELTNANLYSSTFNLEATIAADGVTDESRLALSYPRTVTLEGAEKRLINVTYVTPEEKFWYRSASATLTLVATSAEAEAVSQSQVHLVIVDGFAFQPTMFVLGGSGIIMFAVFGLFVVIGRRHFQERVLGKPVPPWRVPKEAAMLDRLRKDDPKRFYVTRYFLMQEEYESSLLWYNIYKKRQKRVIKHQRTNVKLREKAEHIQLPTRESKWDRKARRWKAWYDWHLRRWAKFKERKIEKLQNKLESHAEDDYNKRLQAWEKKVDKLTKLENKDIIRDRKKWEARRDKAMDKWENEVQKLEESYEKKLAKARADYEKAVKKEDKDTWKAWRSDWEDVSAENRVRESEGQDPLPLPQLKSSKVEEPPWPQKPETPDKPSVGKEPKLRKPDNLPSKPEHETPPLDESSLARKARRKRRKADRKTRKYERKKSKRLAKIEHKRSVHAMGALKKKRQMQAASGRGMKPSVVDRALRRTPEAQERRAERAVLKAHIKDELAHVKETEDAAVARVRAENKRRLAELEAELIRKQAEVRRREKLRNETVPKSLLAEVASLEQRIAKEKEEGAERLADRQEKARQRIEAERERVLKEQEAMAEDGSADADEGKPEAKTQDKAQESRRGRPGKK